MSTQALTSKRYEFHTGNRPETVLPSFADAMYAAGPNQGERVVMLCPKHVGYMKSAGWSKKQVKEFLFKLAQRKASDWARVGVPISPTLRSHGGEPEKGPGEADALRAVAQSPDSITVLVAGGGWLLRRHTPLGRRLQLPLGNQGDIIYSFKAFLKGSKYGNHRL